LPQAKKDAAIARLAELDGKLRHVEEQARLETEARAKNKAELAAQAAREKAAARQRALARAAANSVLSDMIAGIERRAALTQAQAQEEHQADQALDQVCQHVLSGEARAVAEEVMASERAVLSAVHELLEHETAQVCALFAAEACAVRDAEAQASDALAGGMLHAVVHAQSSAVALEALAEADAAAQQLAAAKIKEAEEEEQRAKAEEERVRREQEQMRMEEERRVKEEMGEELCAEILETVVDAECSALVVEEVLGAEAAAKMRGEEEARRLKADEERRVKQQVGDELAAEILEAVAHMESRVLVEEELEERERERARREEESRLAAEAVTADAVADMESIGKRLAHQSEAEAHRLQLQERLRTESQAAAAAAAEAAAIKAGQEEREAIQRAVTPFVEDLVTQLEKTAHAQETAFAAAARQAEEEAKAAAEEERLKREKAARMEEEIRVELLRSMREKEIAEIAAEKAMAAEKEIAADTRRQEVQRISQLEAEADDEQRIEQRIHLEQEVSGTDRRRQTLDQTQAAATALPAVRKAVARGEERGVFAEAMSAAGLHQLLTPRPIIRVGEVRVVEPVQNAAQHAADRTVTKEEHALNLALLEARAHLQRSAQQLLLQQLLSAESRPEQPATSSQPESAEKSTKSEAQATQTRLQSQQNALRAVSPPSRKPGRAEGGRLDWGTANQERGERNASPRRGTAAAGGSKRQAKKQTPSGSLKKQTPSVSHRAGQDMPVAERIQRMQREVSRIKAERAAQGKEKQYCGPYVAGAWAQRDAASSILSPYAQQFSSPTRMSYFEKVKAKLDAKRMARLRQLDQLESIYAPESINARETSVYARARRARTQLPPQAALKSRQKPSDERAQWRNDPVGRQQQQQQRVSRMARQLREAQNHSFTEDAVQRARMYVEEILQSQPRSSAVPHLPAQLPQPPARAGAHVVERARPATPLLAALDAPPHLIAGGEESRPKTAPEGVGKQVAMRLQQGSGSVAPTSSLPTQTKVPETRLDPKQLLQEILQARRQLAENRRIPRPNSASGTCLPSYQSPA